MRIVEQCGMEWSIESVQELHYTQYTDTHTITYSKNRDSAFKLNCYGGLVGYVSVAPAIIISFDSIFERMRCVVCALRIAQKQLKEHPQNVVFAPYNFVWQTKTCSTEVNRIIINETLSIHFHMHSTLDGWWWFVCVCAVLRAGRETLSYLWLLLLLLTLAWINWSSATFENCMEQNWECRS